MSKFDLVLLSRARHQRAAPARAGDGGENDDMHTRLVSATAATVPAALLLAAALVLAAAPVRAQISTAGDWILDEQLRSEELQSCVARGVHQLAGEPRVGWYLGSGPGFTGSGQQVVFRTNSGAEVPVVTGLNSIGDCAYDAGADVLYVSDNGQEAPGSVTGDTLFALAGASLSVAVPALGLEALPAGDLGAAASIALDADGAVFVSDSAGFGNGTVWKLDASGAAPWITGLDFAAGLAVNEIGELLVAETSSSTFESIIRRYDASGSLLGVFSGPTFSHGSFDLSFFVDPVSATEQLLVTGSSALASLDPSASPSVLASGLGFTTGVAFDRAASTVTVLSSAFPATDENRTLFTLTPRNSLIAGKGGAKAECMVETSGVRLVAKRPGKKPKAARCRDGDPSCDADERADGSCLFALGLCANLTDPAFPRCVATRVDSLQVLVRPKKLALPATLASWNADLAAATPLVDETCSRSDGVRVALAHNKKGEPRPGKLRVKIEAHRDFDKPGKDRDKVKLVCLPPS